MSGKPPKTRVDNGTATRAERLKQALKANLARRKAQARARANASDGQKEQG